VATAHGDPGFVKFGNDIGRRGGRNAGGLLMLACLDVAVAIVNNDLV
jgi:hypothetical protein